MANYSSKDVTFTIGGTSMLAHTLTIGGVKISAILQESHAFGKAWFEALTTGIKKMEDLEVGGFYEDTATTGPDAKYGGAAIGTTVAMVLGYGGSKTTSCNVIIESYSRNLARNENHLYKANLRPTGTVTEA